MASMRWNGSIRRFAEAAIALAAVLALRGDGDLRACGYYEPSIDTITMFDPAVIGEPIAEGLLYDPFTSGFGGPCDACMRKEAVADWSGYLRGAVTDADWEKLLFVATSAELEAVRLRFGGKQTPAPAGYETSSLWTVPPPQRARVEAALAFVALARRVEPLATFVPTLPSSGSPLDEALARLAVARDPFLKQRYAFLAVRLYFYGKAWPELLAYARKQAATLEKPSAQIAWRTRWYVAGALARSGQRGRANLELARIHMGYPPLSGAAAQDWKPLEKADWQESLRLATTVREKTELWRIAGIRSDAVAAMQEIFKLDPRSKLLALLAVRELARVESMNGMRSDGPPTPADAAALQKQLAPLEELAVRVAATPGADRPWLMELIAGHVAAQRGDLAAARPRLERATAARPGDKVVASQARASLAMALSLSWKAQPAEQTELARAIAALDPSYRRTAAVRREVRAQLASSYATKGDLVEAELLQPGFLEQDPQRKARWADTSFIDQMIARTDRAATDFDRFVLSETYTRPRLERERGGRALLAGDFATAARLLPAAPPLGTDPFVIHIRDCQGCDHERYANAPWTAASFAARLVELQVKAQGPGEPAAQAAFALGNALYNVTRYGNARMVLADTHSETRDTAPAERWYKRAFDLTRDRELKARAAFMAAKCELGALTTEEDEHREGRLHVPKTWFGVLKDYRDTKYYKEVIGECSNFRRWSGR